MSTWGKRVRRLEFFSVEVTQHYEDGHFYRPWVSFIFPGFKVDMQHTVWRGWPRAYCYRGMVDLYLPGLTVNMHFGSHSDNTGEVCYSGDAEERDWKRRRAV